MKTFLKTLFGIALVLTTLSCGKYSKAYKELQLQHDSLNTNHTTLSKEFEEIFSIINEVEEGLSNIRESENQIAQYSKREEILSGEMRQKVEESIKDVAESIELYRLKIAQLQSKSNFNSKEYTKRLNSLQEELQQKSTIIEKLERELGIANLELKEKSEELLKMDQALSNLKMDIASLEQKRVSDRETLAKQEELLYSGYYFADCKKELIEKGVITKGGLFSPSKISFEANPTLFKRVDIRTVKEIPLESAKAKVLSLHPVGSYKIEPNGEGKATLYILSQNNFWSRAKYLVIRLK
ncbi:MAG: hypothetical protein WC960_00740 [Bacteroidales bacterium]